ncbi:MAG: hypothetical protein WDN25_03840 [Acetobacteraceae bacterium]
MTPPAELRRAIDDCLIGGNHLSSLLGADAPPASASTAEAISHYGPESPTFQLWMTWRAIARLRQALADATASPAGPAEPMLLDRAALMQPKEANSS